MSDVQDKKNISKNNNLNSQNFNDETEEYDYEYEEGDANNKIIIMNQQQMKT